MKMPGRISDSCRKYPPELIVRGALTQETHAFAFSMCDYRYRDLIVS